jgi:chromosome segregation ATPase
LQDLLSKLSTETDAEGALLNAHNSTLTDLNAIGGDVVGVSRAPVQSPADADRKAAELAKIREQLDALLPRIDRSWDRPAKLVERTRTSDLAAQRDQLLAAVDDASRELATRSQLVAVAPTIETVTEILRGRLNELETAQQDVHPDEQQRQLDELEEKRAELERALALIPDGPEGDELRRKAEWDLSQLTDWLKRLGRSLRDKLAALAAHDSRKTTLREQLADIEQQLAPALTADLSLQQPADYWTALIILLRVE